MGHSQERHRRVRKGHGQLKGGGGQVEGEGGAGGGAEGGRREGQVGGIKSFRLCARNLPQWWKSEDFKNFVKELVRLGFRFWSLEFRI